MTIGQQNIYHCLHGEVDTLLITGSRNMNRQIVEEVLDRFMSHMSPLIIPPVEDDGEEFLFVKPALFHGDAKGVDRIAADIFEKAECWVDKHSIHVGYQVYAFPADWDKHGRSAGPKRNQAMADDWFMGIDAKHRFFLGIWDGSSRGTKHMVDYVTSLGVPAKSSRYKGTTIFYHIPTVH